MDSFRQSCAWGTHVEVLVGSKEEAVECCWTVGLLVSDLGSLGKLIII